MIYATVNADGSLIGFFDDSINATIPAGAKQLTTAQYTQWLAQQKSHSWQNGALVAVQAPASTSVPQQISMFQAKAALLAQPGAEAGKTLLDDVNSWVATQPALTQLAWSESAVLGRASLFVQQATAHFNWTGATLDALFTAGAAITP